jgi:hypothetical protein
VAIWRELPRRAGSNDVAMLSTRSAGQAFGRPRRVSSAGVSDVEVAMAADGEFVVAWARRGLVEARLGRGSKLGSVQRLASNHVVRADDVSVAMDGRGDAVAAWKSHNRTFTPSATERFNFAYRLAGYAFSPATQVTAWLGHPLLTRVGVGAAFYSTRRALLAWNGRDGGGDGVFAVAVSGPSPGTARRLSPAVSQPGPGEFDQLQAVAGARRAATVAWSHFDAEGASFDSQGHLLASVRDQTGSFALEPVTAPSIDALDATVAYSPRDGSVLALWRTKSTNRAFVPSSEFADASTRR